MNIRRIAQAIRLMESFDEDEKRLLNTLMMASASEREVLVESLQPQKPATKKASKKSSKKPDIPLCVACNYSESSIVHKKSGGLSDYHEFQPPATKSRRASGMAEQLSSRRQGQRITLTPCAFVCADKSICGEPEGSPVHDKSFGYAAYHPFIPAVPAATTPSPANGGAESIIRNSVDETVSAGAVAGGSNE